MLETILVPLDGSKCAEAALAVAALIPSRRIRLVNVRSDLIQLDEICASAHDGEAYLERVAEPLREQGRQIETNVVFGDARRQIVALAAMADLVVMGSRGCGATSAFFLGSVADWVARHAPAPTLIVRAGETPPSGGDSSPWQGEAREGAGLGGEIPAVTMPLTRIVVPLDGSPLAETALPMASELAADLGLPIHLVRVLEFDVVRASVEAGLEAAQDSAQHEAEEVAPAEAYLAAEVQELRNHNLVTSSEVRTGLPVTEILATVRAGDLLVLTTRERGGLERWLLGSVADELVRHAPGPVLLVRATTQQTAAQSERAVEGAS